MAVREVKEGFMFGCSVLFCSASLRDCVEDANNRGREWVTGDGRAASWLEGPFVC